MATSVTLPALGESVTEGTVTRWLKQPGDQVAVDEPLLEVSTDKVDTEIPSPVAGTLLDIKVAEDETVEVGSELAVIGSGDAASGGGAQPSQADDVPKSDAGEDEATGDGASEAGSQGVPSAVSGSDQSGSGQSGSNQTGSNQTETPAETQQQAPAQAKVDTAAQQAEGGGTPREQAAGANGAPSGGASDGGGPDGGGSGASDGGAADGGAYVTPLVRKMAAEQGVDLASVTGTGVGGRIRKQDVLDAAKKAQEAPAEAAPAASAPSSPPPAPASQPSPLRGKTEPMTRLRKVIAKRMVESLQTSAQLTTVVEVDVTNISRLRNAAKAEFLAREGVKLSFMPFFAKAAIDSLKAHP